MTKEGKHIKMLKDAIETMTLSRPRKIGMRLCIPDYSVELDYKYDGDARLDYLKAHQDLYSKLCEIRRKAWWVSNV